MATSVSVRYVLKPPAEVVIGHTLSTSKTFEFNVTDSVDKGMKKYYDGLRDAISDARVSLGEDLTLWRDAVGSAEQSKESKKTLKLEAGEDDDEGEDHQ